MSCSIKSGELLKADWNLRTIPFYLDDLPLTSTKMRFRQEKSIYRDLWVISQRHSAVYGSKGGGLNPATTCRAAPFSHRPRVEVPLLRATAVNGSKLRGKVEKLRCSAKVPTAHLPDKPRAGRPLSLVTAVNGSKRGDLSLSTTCQNAPFFNIPRAGLPHWRAPAINGSKLWGREAKLRCFTKDQVALLPDRPRAGLPLSLVTAVCRSKRGHLSRTTTCQTAPFLDKPRVELPHWRATAVYGSKLWGWVRRSTTCLTALFSDRPRVELPPSRTIAVNGSKRGRSIRTTACQTAPFTHESRVLAPHLHVLRCPISTTKPRAEVPSTHVLRCPFFLRNRSNLHRLFRPYINTMYLMFTNICMLFFFYFPDGGPYVS